VPYNEVDQYGGYGKPIMVRRDKKETPKTDPVRVFALFVTAFPKLYLGCNKKTNAKSRTFGERNESRKAERK
jgi:hypothetical protein